MGVYVQAIRQDGLTSSKVRHVCFGFAGSADAWRNRFGLNFPHYECSAIKYFPNKHPSLRTTTAQTYLSMLNTLGLFKRISPCTTMKEIFSAGVQADLSKLSGQEWVGCFELIRHCEYNPSYVEWVVHLHKKLHFSVGESFYWPKVILLPTFTWLKNKTSSYSEVTVTTNDTTPPVLFSHFSVQLLSSRLQDKTVVARYRPYTESPDFRGVYDFWHPLSEKMNLNKIPFNLRIHIRGGLLHTYYELEHSSDFYFTSSSSLGISRSSSSKLYEFLVAISQQQKFTSVEEICRTIQQIKLYCN